MCGIVSLSKIICGIGNGKDSLCISNTQERAPKDKNFLLRRQNILYLQPNDA